MNSVHDSLERHHVDLLIQLAQTGHLGRAAAALNVSPSAASHRLREAERRLGVSLTTAAGRSLRLTPAAMHLAEVGENAHRALRAAEESARWMAAASRQAVRIAIDFYDTAPWFERLPDQPTLPCDIDFVRVGYGDVIDAVTQQRADLGLHPHQQLDGSIDPKSAALQTERLSTDTLVGIVRAGHPAAVRGLLEPTDITTATYATAGDRPARGFEHHEFFEPAGVRPLRLQKVESLAMILRLIRRHGGITVQPALSLATAHLDGLAVVPLADTTITVDWTVVARNDASSDVHAIIGSIRELLDTGRSW